ncbi:uncharacterized protein LOC122574655 isoform X1 [Bombus pyrosoma]|uniref:uncharacterized protein LOC122574655 isoform X1 n=1 Tax=Bombus pyrosoma TaxID=396416 RepID=UPI001CB8AD6C|nr:uncharacterized protein LOC122574655 isoform X1 [Bombus pyrosoma]XP_043598414.1 uncharacterized protein LOC122574655 isoform X1 [Bombus pyrosoma]XP_043598415.1 uncharacterized protein LOC122574655 isoform X1 [Bombus pyrosoma]XP_043598417.1 uncharacterized protein LOC122574655 isoform X1 [Bombus pyrosoma]
MKMCSTSPKGNCIREVNRILEASSLVTCAISSNSSCRGKDLKEEEKVKSIIQEEDDLLPSNYLDKNIFGLLISALEETLIEASEQNVLWVQKCRFNGLDYIAEFLWNRNPRRPKIYTPPLNVFDIPLFKEYLRSHPRPYYPKSWLWSEDEAALHIQKYVRGWLVRKRANVQEMRKFWKDIAVKSLFGKKEIHSVQFQRLLGMFYYRFVAIMILIDLICLQVTNKTIQSTKQSRKTSFVVKNTGRRTHIIQCEH